MTRTTLALAAALALAACDRGPANGTPAAAPTAGAPQAQAGQDAAAELDALYAEFWEESLRLNPLSATYIGDSRYNDQLPDTFSAEFRQRQLDFAQRWLERVRGYDVEQLEGQARLSYEIFVSSLEEQIEGERFPGWQQPLNQFYSFPSSFAMLGSGTGAQPFRTVADYDNWLARASNIPTLLDSAMANMREGMANGVVQPRVLVEKTLPQLDGLIKDDPEQTLFWRPIAEMPEDFPEAERDRLTEAYRSLIADTLMPAYRALRRFTAEEYLPAARDSHGLDALPDGEAWYAFNVRRITTTDLTPAQIHDIGLAEVERIHGEMRQVMQEVGFEGDLQAFFEYMTTDPAFTYESEEALLADYSAFEATVDARVGELFSLTPKAAFEIRPVEAFRAQSAAGGSYMRPSEDGSRPGIFYVNTYDLPTRKTWDRDALYLHEAIPGHHFQIALQQELEGIPTFRRFGGQTAYIEGWGLYAESLGRELGVYADPYTYFGRLQAELWRAIRLVVDTGLHSKGWTREQVIQYMKDNSATSDTEAVSETERYMAIPGQALAYKVGELKIKELRARAEAALGEAFDPRAFHAEVLGDGSLPLDVLEAKIDRWIAAQS